MVGGAGGAGGGAGATAAGCAWWRCGVIAGLAAGGAGSGLAEWCMAGAVAGECAAAAVPQPAASAVSRASPAAERGNVNDMMYLPGCCFSSSAATEAYTCHYGPVPRSRSARPGVSDVALLTAGLARLLGQASGTAGLATGKAACEPMPGGDVPLIARFQVDSFEPRQVAGLDADWVGLMTFAKTFTSGITGHATTLFMSAGSEEGSRSYVATERITGRTGDGREGSVTVQHGGLESDPDSWFGHIVPGTGTGGFAGWAGSARIVHDDQGPYFEFGLA